MGKIEYPLRVTMEDAYALAAEAGEWADYLEGEAEPGSDDLYTVQQLRKVIGAMNRLVDERDALIYFRERRA